MSDFLPLKGNFRDLIVYQKAECIYDITYHFAHRFLAVNDRTIDQMIQTARSGKQNIAEGSASSTTSRESELKLLNVAKASFKELMLDYEDYLRVRNLEIWANDSEKAQQTRTICANHNNSAYYRQAISIRSDETIANIALVLIHKQIIYSTNLSKNAKRNLLRKVVFAKSSTEHAKIRLSPNILLVP